MMTFIYRTRAFRSTTPKSSASENPAMRKPLIGLACFLLEYAISLLSFPILNTIQ